MVSVIHPRIQVVGNIPAIHFTVRRQVLAIAIVVSVYRMMVGRIHMFCMPMAVALLPGNISGIGIIPLKGLLYRWGRLVMVVVILSKQQGICSHEEYYCEYFFHNNCVVVQVPGQKGCRRRQ